MEMLKGLFLMFLTAVYGIVFVVSLVWGLWELGSWLASFVFG